MGKESSPVVRQPGADAGSYIDLFAKGICDSARILSALELSANGFGFRVQLQRFVTHLTAPARLLIAAERECGVEHVVAIDPDSSGTKLGRNLVRPADVTRPNRSRQAIVGTIGKTNYFLGFAERNGSYYRAKNFFPHNFHFSLYIN